MKAHIRHMSKIEQAIAVPIRQIVHPVALAAGSAIALTGVALLIARFPAVL